MEPALERLGLGRVMGTTNRGSEIGGRTSMLGTRPRISWTSSGSEAAAGEERMSCRNCLCRRLLGGRRPSLVPYVTVTRPKDGATASRAFMLPVLQYAVDNHFLLIIDPSCNNTLVRRHLWSAFP
jgi:hypothetical protein